MDEAASWRFRFHSEKTGAFQINPDDPTWIEPDAQKPAAKLEMCLSACRIDAASAYLMADLAGCTFGDNHILALEAVSFDGRWRPAWLVPMRFGMDGAAVLADSCELIAQTAGSWRKPPGVIWNT